MVNSDLVILERDFPVSHALLMHGDLMTRVLIQHFGAVHAMQTAIEHDGDSVTRWSTLYQTATGAPLLHATLIINKPALPEGLLERLLNGTRLFGGLLIEAGVAVRMTDRTVYRAGPPGGVYAGTWGRRQRMLLADDGVLVCDVDECLVEETVLRSLVFPLDHDDHENK